jgi:exodeoxyribonuclease VII large subunit
MMTSDEKKTTVSQLNFKIKALLESASILQDIWISGEISNFKYFAQGGQYYFNLSDDTATINCVLYATALQYMNFQPANKQKVTVRGKVIVFQKRGQLMFQAAYMTEDGLGDQAKQLNALIKQLHAEGLFDPEHKLPIPEFPDRIGIITSPDSAALWDFVTTYKQIASYSRLMVIPAVMQGASSALSIIEALDFAASEKLDVIVIIRGGGSAQDLASFNDEKLVRALFHCPIPSVTGLGHDVDHSLLDLVADKKCSTPTACAEFIAKPVFHLKEFIRLSMQRFESKLLYLLDQDFDTIHDALREAAALTSEKIEKAKKDTEILTEKLVYLNPFNPVKRGYSIVEKHNHRVRSVKSLVIGDTIHTQFIDGTIESVVSDIHYEHKKH